MRIVHLCTSDFGGAAMAAVQLHVELLRRNEQSVFITLNKTRKDIPNHFVTNGFDTMHFPGMGRFEYKVKAAFQKYGIIDDKRNQPDNFHLKNKSPEREVFTLPYSYFNILNHPEVQSADLIHLHWVSFGMIDYGKFFSEISKPVVWTLHDMYPFTGGCHHADECTLFEDSCSNCPQLPDQKVVRKWWKYKQNALSRVPVDKLQLVVPSSWLGSLGRKSSLLGTFDTQIIRNGFDTGVFHPTEKAAARAKLELPQNEMLFLFNAYDVANSRKGIKDLLEAFSTLEQGNIRLVCLGSLAGPEFSGLNILKRGYVSDQRVVADYFNACDYFVLPSKAENLPNTICESLLCGTPVIAYAIGGVKEQVNEKNGFLVSNLSSELLTSAIRQAIEEKSRFNRNGISIDAQSLYSIKSTAGEYLSLYQKMLR